MFFEEITLKVIYHGRYVNMIIYPWDPQGKFAHTNVDYFIGVFTNEAGEDMPLIEIGELTPGVFTELSRVKELTSPWSVIEKTLQQQYAEKKNVEHH